ncbi:hypothetical protein [Alkalibacterium pelagium]|uniref:hypothetical protein n=1 Tax=Alkalibacterium pelagium TaxID=426702 RepID=UPI001478E7D6|nr:hypothetical protein [Alkalibacterium pelagium]
MADMKSGKWKKSGGFILLEALISLSLVTLAVCSMLPFLVDTFVIREEAKLNVETSRFLYETAQFWDRTDQSVAMMVDGKLVVIVEGDNGITVKGEKISDQMVEILSVQWKK